MPWKGTQLSCDEVKAFERLWPLFYAVLEKRRAREFTVADFFDWVEAHPEYGVKAIRGDGGKIEARRLHPNAVIVNVQNALYHLSASSPKFVIRDMPSGRQVTLLHHIGRLTYCLL
jgi:hypothetical protein